MFVHVWKTDAYVRDWDLHMDESQFEYTGKREHGEVTESLLEKVVTQ